MDSNEKLKVLQTLLAFCYNLPTILSTTHSSISFGCLLRRTKVLKFRETGIRNTRKNWLFRGFI